MASVAGSAIGFAIGGPFGMAIGGLIGSIIDQMVLMPMLNDTAQDSGPRVLDLKMSAPSEGTPAPKMFGRRVRVGGQILRHSGLYSETVQATRRGKRQEPAHTTWYGDMIVGFAWSHCTKPPLRVIVDGGVLYDRSIPSFSGLISLTKQSSGPGRNVYVEHHWKQVAGLGAGTFDFFELVIETARNIDGLPVDPSLPFDQFPVGARVRMQVAGTVALDDAGNPGEIPFGRPASSGLPQLDNPIDPVTGKAVLDWTVVASEQLDNKGNKRLVINVLDWRTSFPPPFGQHISPWPNMANGDTIEVEQGPEFYNERILSGPTGNNQVFGVEFMDGSPTQGPTDLIQELLLADDSGHFENFRGIAGIAIEKLKASAFGNRLPTTITAILEHSTRRTLRECVGGIFEEWTPGLGLPGTTKDRVGQRIVDVEAIPDEAGFGGIQMEGLFRGIDALGRIGGAFDLHWRENRSSRTAGVRTWLQVFRGDQRDTYALLLVHVGAGMLGDELPKPLRARRIDERSRLRRVEVSYAKWTDGQRGDETAELEHAAYEGVEQMNLDNLTLQRDLANKIARRVIEQNWLFTHEIELTATCEGIYTQGTDVVLLPGGGRGVLEQPWNVIVSAVYIQPEWLVNIEGRAVNELIGAGPEGVDLGGDSPAVGREGGSPGADPAALQVRLFTLDLPPLRDEHARRSGFYAAVMPYSATYAFPGAEVWGRLQGEEEWVLLSTIPHASHWGVLTSELQAVETRGWDRVSAPLVSMRIGALESRTEDDVLGGHNQIVIGEEVVGVVDATPQGEGVYQLSTMIRGRRLTSVGAQPVGSLVFPASSLAFIDVPHEWLDGVLEVRAIAIGQDLDSVATRFVNLSGKTIRTPDVVDVATRQLADGSVDVSWSQRSLVSVRAFSQPPVVDQGARFAVSVGGATVLGSGESLRRQGTARELMAQNVDAASVQPLPGGELPPGNVESR